MGGSNVLQVFPNYLICLRFIRIITVSHNVQKHLQTKLYSLNTYPTHLFVIARSILLYCSICWVPIEWYICFVSNSEFISFLLQRIWLNLVTVLLHLSVTSCIHRWNNVMNVLATEQWPEWPYQWSTALSAARIGITILALFIIIIVGMVIMEDLLKAY